MIPGWGEIPRVATLADRYRRLAPGRRLLAWLVGTATCAGLWALILLAAGASSDAIVRPERHPGTQRVYLAGLYLILLGGAAGTWRLLEGASWEELGWAFPTSALRDWGLGLLVGVAMMTFHTGVALGLGLATFRPEGLQGLTPGLTIELAVMALGFGASEELLFRGFVLQTLARGGQARTAVFGSALVFAAAHFLRGGLTWWQVLPPGLGLSLIGAFLGWLALRTRSVWAGAGLHAGWLAVFLTSDRLALTPARGGLDLLAGGGYPPGGLLLALSVAALWGALAWGLGRDARREG